MINFYMCDKNDHHATWWYRAHNTLVWTPVCSLCLPLWRSWLWLIVGVFSNLRHWWTGGPSSYSTSTANPATTTRYPRLYGNSWFWLAYTTYSVYFSFLYFLLIIPINIQLFYYLCIFMFQQQSVGFVHLFPKTLLRVNRD